jgi:ATP-dependent Clp protease ATP-binding subunit ClpA
LIFASDEADGLGHGFVTCQHLLYALAREGKGIASIVLAQAGISPQALHDLLTDTSSEHDRTDTIPIDLADEVRRTLDRAVKVAQEWDASLLDTEHILYGLISASTSADDMLSTLNVPPKRLLERLLTLHITAPPELVQNEAIHTYRFSIETGWILGLANHFAGQQGAEVISTMHLLMALVTVESEVRNVFTEEFGVTADVLFRRMGGTDRKVTSSPARLALGRDVQRVIGFAIGEAWGRGHQTITPCHIGLGLVRSDRSPALDLLAEYGASADNLLDTLDQVMPPPVTR